MNTQSIFKDNLLSVLFLLILKISRGTEIVYCIKLKNPPRGIWLDFYILMLNKKRLYSNATRVAFRGKMHFCMRHRSSYTHFHSVEIVIIPLPIRLSV